MIDLDVLLYPYSAEWDMRIIPVNERSKGEKMLVMSVHYINYTG